jgi:hypothetical protein
MLQGCGGTPVDLPSVDELDRDVIYCKVNGENWKSQSYFPYAGTGVERTADRGVRIYGSHPNSPAGIAALDFCFDSLVTGPQRLVKAGGLRNSPSDCDSCGTVNLIEIDSVALTLRGTFEFQLRAANGDSIRVTDGRFYVGVPFRF